MPRVVLRDNMSDNIILLVKNIIHSFIFVPAFSLGRNAGPAALGRLEISHDQQQSQIVVLAPHRDGPNEVGDVATPPGLWSTSGLLSRGCKPAGLASPIFPGIV